MYTAQLIEAVRNLLSIGEYRREVCGQCNHNLQTRFGTVGGEAVCEDCIRTHAEMVLQHAESCCAADANQ
jgi:hypothetical protein